MLHHTLILRTSEIAVNHEHGRMIGTEMTVIPIFSIAGLDQPRYSALLVWTNPNIQQMLVWTNPNIQHCWFGPTPIFSIAGLDQPQYSALLVWTNPNIQYCWFGPTRIFSTAGLDQPQLGHYAKYMIKCGDIKR